MLNDHLSILDSNNDAILNKSTNFEGAEGAEGDDGESGYVSKESQKNIRIKVWKQSVEQHGKKSKAIHSAANSKLHMKSSEENSTESIRAGSPINYVWDKKKKMLE